LLALLGFGLIPGPGNVALFRMRALRVRYGLAGPFSLGGDLRLSVCYAFLTCGIG